MARIGSVQCGLCGNPEASVSRTGTGTLSMVCHRCEYSAFSKPGTKAHRLTSAALTLDDDAPAADPAPAKPAKASKAAPAADPAPALRRPVSVFSLGDLS